MQGQEKSSLRGRRSKGKGNGIRARDHTRGMREEEGGERAPKFPLPLPLLTPPTQARKNHVLGYTAHPLVLRTGRAGPHLGTDHYFSWGGGAGGGELSSAIISILEVLIEKGSAVVSCELRIGQRQFVEQLNI